MTVGKPNATVLCKNKKVGKKRASPVTIQALQPHVRCCCNTRTQDMALHTEPNYAVLEKLRNEMMKLRERKERENLNNVDL